MGWGIIRVTIRLGLVVEGVGVFLTGGPQAIKGGLGNKSVYKC